MLTLALDTTTRAGSVALMRDDALLEVFVGDSARTHAARLPGDALEVLRRHHLGWADVDLFAVAAGPGSFTGLRIGIAAIQGLAFANAKPVVAVSTLDALAHAGFERLEGTARPGAKPVPADRPSLVGAWMDAQRGEVYAALFAATADGEPRVLEPPVVAPPADVVTAWRERFLAPPDPGEGPELLLVGDGALAYRDLVQAGLPRARVVEPVPPLAPSIAALAGRRAAAGLAGPPHAVRPVYVRRPDAELARERARQAGGLVPSAAARTEPRG
jgi:tRNA threonylcarbamoyladenosine biosynthesis protein TsaB